MTKADIIERISSGTGLTKIDTEVVVDGFFKTIIDALAAGHGIEIRGFGSFKVRKKKPRNARNPRTGEKVYVGEHYVPAFKFSKDFKAAVDLGMKQLLENQKVVDEKM
ncbi:MAG: integration host factor subunit beta [Melioribacteraceae bacterium]|nr:integration host factor subunit beta [Melioribacteraceae bacterium]